MDIACIVFICTTVNHLGLVSAVEAIIKARLLVVNCPKCLAFWMTVLYGCNGIAAYEEGITVLAVSFLASYAAVWLELLEGYVDTLYMKCYEKIYSEPDDDTTASDTDQGHSAGPVS